MSTPEGLGDAWSHASRCDDLSLHADALDFAVAIVSEVFQGKTPIARHRMVNSLLKEEFDQGLHALSLRLKTPEEWDKETAARV